MCILESRPTKLLSCTGNFFKTPISLFCYLGQDNLLMTEYKYLWQLLESQGFLNCPNSLLMCYSSFWHRLILFNFLYHLGTESPPFPRRLRQLSPLYQPVHSGGGVLQRVAAHHNTIPHTVSWAVQMVQRVHRPRRRPAGAHLIQRKLPDPVMRLDVK